MVYVNPSEATSAYVSIGKFVYRCAPHPDVPPRAIALNDYQRQAAPKVYGDEVEVTDFLVPMRDFTLDTVTLQAERVVKINASPPATVTMAHRFRYEFEGHVLTKDQLLIMPPDSMYLLKVTSDVQGLLTMKTNVVIQWMD